jgi:hypothetical protein
MVRSFILIEEVFRSQLVWRARMPLDNYVSLSVDRLLCVGISGFASSLVSARLPASALFSWLPQSILPYSGVLDVLSNSFFVVDT